MPDDEVLQELRLRGGFPKLATLAISLGCDNKRDFMNRFLKADLPSSLRYLKLEGIHNLDEGISNDVPEVVDAIASSPGSRRLRAISLPGFSQATFGRFMETFRVPLEDVGQQSHPEVLEQLCRNPELASGLKRLNLCGYGLGDPGVAFLACCPYFARLAHLNLSANAIGPDGLAFLAGSPMLPNLERLDLSRNPLGDDGWEILARLPFRRLRSLNLWHAVENVWGATEIELGARSATALAPGRSPGADACKGCNP